jgi:hypothetical protein
MRLSSLLCGEDTFREFFEQERVSLSLSLCQMKRTRKSKEE